MKGRLIALLEQEGMPSMAACLDDGRLTDLLVDAPEADASHPLLDGACRFLREGLQARHALPAGVSRERLAELETAASRATDPPPVTTQAGSPA